MVCDKDSGERSMAQGHSCYIYALSAKLVGVGRMLFLMSFFSFFFIYWDRLIIGCVLVLSSQPRVTVMSRFVYKVNRDLESIDHLCINPIHRIALIHK